MALDSLSVVTFGFGVVARQTLDIASMAHYLDSRKAACTLFVGAVTADGSWQGSIPAILRQQMGHSSMKMTALYTGEIPLEQVQKVLANGRKNVVLENMENEATA